MLVQNKRLGTKPNTLVLEFHNTHLYIVLNHDMILTNSEVELARSFRENVVSCRSVEASATSTSGTEQNYPQLGF